MRLFRTLLETGGGSQELKKLLDRSPLLEAVADGVATNALGLRRRVPDDELLDQVIVWTSLLKTIKAGQDPELERLLEAVVEGIRASREERLGLGPGPRRPQIPGRR